MHESSLAKALLKQLLQLACDRRATAVVLVQLQVGEFSGVEPALLAAAFNRLTAGTIAEGAQLDLQITPLTARCNSCDELFRPVGFRFCCPHCGADNVSVHGGEELVLSSVDLSLPGEVPTCQ